MVLAATETTETEADEELLVDQGEIMAELARQDPGSITQGGLAVSRFEGAVLQSSDPKTMSASFVILTAQKSPNRNGNMVQIAPSDLGGGVLIDSYKQNPIVLFDHGQSHPLPIGTSEDANGTLRYKATKQKAVAEVFFSQSSPFAADIFGLVQEGILRAASAGFMPMKATPIRQRFERMAEGVSDISPGSTGSCFGGFNFTEVDLMEWSIVTVGADAGALRQCLSAAKIGGEKIASPLTRHWLQQRAETKPTIGRGFDASDLAPVVTQSVVEVAEAPQMVIVQYADGITLTGSPDMVAATMQKLSVPASTPETVAVIEEQKATEPVDTNANLNANESQQITQSPNLVEEIARTIPGIVTAEIQKGLQSCLQLQQQTLKNLKVLTGVSP